MNLFQCILRYFEIIFRCKSIAWNYFRVKTLKLTLCSQKTPCATKVKGFPCESCGCLWVCEGLGFSYERIQSRWGDDCLHWVLFNLSLSQEYRVHSHHIT